MPGDRISLCNDMYRVHAVVGSTVTLDRLVAPNTRDARERREPSPELQAARHDGRPPPEAWVLLECRSETPNPDMQNLLMNLDAHKHAIKFLPELERGLARAAAARAPPPSFDSPKPTARPAAAAARFPPPPPPRDF